MKTSNKNQPRVKPTELAGNNLSSVPLSRSRSRGLTTMVVSVAALMCAATQSGCSKSGAITDRPIITKMDNFTKPIENKTINSSAIVIPDASSFDRLKLIDDIVISAEQFPALHRELSVALEAGIKVEVTAMHIDEDLMRPLFKINKTLIPSTAELLAYLTDYNNPKPEKELKVQIEPVTKGKMTLAEVEKVSEVKEEAPVDSLTREVAKEISEARPLMPSAVQLTREAHPDLLYAYDRGIIDYEILDGDNREVVIALKYHSETSTVVVPLDERIPGEIRTADGPEAQKSVLQALKKFNKYQSSSEASINSNGNRVQHGAISTQEERIKTSLPRNLAVFKNPSGAGANSLKQKVNIQPAAPIMNNPVPSPSRAIKSVAPETRRFVPLKDSGSYSSPRVQYVEAAPTATTCKTGACNANQTINVYLPPENVSQTQSFVARPARSGNLATFASASGTSHGYGNSASQYTVRNNTYAPQQRNFVARPVQSGNLATFASASGTSYGYGYRRGANIPYGAQFVVTPAVVAVSYTHLTLPTIYSV